MTLRPARVELDADGVPHAPDFGDRYHPRIGAAAQARHVFLAGNGLPGRWAGRSDFTLLETGFGLGNNFLATWAAWRADPQRPQRLHYVAIEAHPPQLEDLRRCAGDADPELAAALRRAWPPLVPGLHALDFDDGHVRLLLAFGDVARIAKELVLTADAVYLDGFAPDRNPAMWTPALMRLLARKLPPGGTAATWSVAAPVRDALRAAGFACERVPGIGGKREVLRAVLAPGWAAPARATQQPPARAAGHALVLGAGLAGAWAAWALARQGWQVRVLDRHAQPAAEASGNPAGLFHPGAPADADTPHARLLRAAALRCARLLAPWIAAGRIAGDAGGLLRLAPAGAEVDALRAQAARQGVPPALAEPLDAAAAGARAGLALQRAGWWLPSGGWVAPGELVRQLLATPGVRFEGAAAVDRIARDGSGWALHGADGCTLARAPVLVLANGAEATRLWPQAGWTLGRSRGQISWWRTPPPGAPRPAHPVTGEGYLLALPDGGLLCGATAAAGDPDPALRDADHDFNRHRLQALCGWPAPPPDGGRVGWRALTRDRLPLVGPVPAADADAAAGRGREPAREPGLYVLAGLGSRGISWGPLAAEVLASWICGTPMPVEARLRDALDPGRMHRRRAARRAGAG